MVLSPTQSFSDISSDSCEPDARFLELDHIPRKEPKQRMSRLYWQVQDQSPTPQLHVSVGQLCHKKIPDHPEGHLFRTRRLIQIGGGDTGPESNISTVRRFELSSVRKPTRCLHRVVDTSSSYFLEQYRRMRDATVQVQLIGPDLRETDRWEDLIRETKPAEPGIKRPKSSHSYVNTGTQVDLLKEIDNWEDKQSRTRPNFRRPKPSEELVETGVQVDLYDEIDHWEDKQSRTRPNFRWPKPSEELVETGIQVDLYEEVDHWEEKQTRSRSNFRRQKPSEELVETGVQVDIYKEIDHWESKQNRPRAKLGFKRTVNSNTQTFSESKLDAQVQSDRTAGNILKPALLSIDTQTSLSSQQRLTRGCQTVTLSTILSTESTQTLSKKTVDDHSRSVKYHTNARCQTASDRYDSQLDKSATDSKDATRFVNNKTAQIGASFNELKSLSTQTNNQYKLPSQNDRVEIKKSISGELEPPIIPDRNMKATEKREIKAPVTKSDTATNTTPEPDLETKEGISPSEKNPKREVEKPLPQLRSTETQTIEDEYLVKTGHSSHIVPSFGTASQTKHGGTVADNTTQTIEDECLVKSGHSSHTVPSFGTASQTKHGGTVADNATQTIEEASTAMTADSFHITPSLAVTCQTKPTVKAAARQEFGCQVTLLVGPTEHCSVQTRTTAVKNLGCQVTYIVTPTEHIAAQTTVVARHIGSQIGTLVPPTEDAACQIDYLVAPTEHVSEQTNIPVRTLACQVTMLTKHISAQTQVPRNGFGCQVATLSAPTEDMTVQTAQVFTITESTQHIAAGSHKSCVADSLIASTEHVHVQSTGPSVTSRSIQNTTVTLDLGCQAATLVAPTEDQTHQTNPFLGCKSVALQMVPQLKHIGFQAAPPPWSYMHVGEQTCHRDFSRNQQIQCRPRVLSICTQSQPMRLADSSSFIYLQETDRAIQTSLAHLLARGTQVPRTLVADAALQILPATREAASLVEGGDLVWGEDKSNQIDTAVEVMTRVVFRSSQMDSLDVVAIDESFEME